jgi:plastocyanin
MSLTASTAQTINVGQQGLSLSPSTLTVPVGNTVEFHFFPGEHSVGQSSFGDLCNPLNTISFYSGFVSTNSGEAGRLTLFHSVYLEVLAVTRVSEAREKY